MKTLAIATCAEVPDLDEDGPALIRALADRGIQAQPAVWDDPAVPWQQFDRVLVRSTWDYPAKWASFLRWVDAVSALTRLSNAADVIRWNVDKRYLRRLSTRGVPIVPTWWIEPGDNRHVPRELWEAADELVVKPAISAGSKDTGRFRPSDPERIDALIADILASDRPVMLQPYVQSVDELGETALLYMGGTYSHAIRKGPLLEAGGELESGLFRPEEIEPRVAENDELALAEQVFEALPFDRTSLAYARIDVVRDLQGAPRIIEVELIEPSMFLQHDERAARTFADALVRAEP